MIARYATHILMCLTLLLAVSCGEADDTSVDKQPDNIESYLNKNNMEDTLDRGVYRHIANADREGYDDATRMETGDLAELMFEAYSFTTDRQGLFYTNKPYIIDSLSERYGFNTEYCERGPKEIRLGSTELVEGLEYGQNTCCEGDSELGMSSTRLAFGEQGMGTVEKHMAVVYYAQRKT